MEQRLYSNFINSIRSEETKRKYKYCLEDFTTFVGTDNLTDLAIEQSVIDYIGYMRDRKLSSKTINVRLSAIYHFYAMNDVTLNKVKIGKFKPEFVRTKKDRAYSHSEIGKMLQNSELRMKICILLMATSGLRLGALSLLKLKNIENNKLVGIYEGTNEEYFTFITPETQQFIQEYINQRRLIGEKVTDEAYLIREHFDVFNPKESRGISKSTIRHIIQKILKKSGIKVNVSETHGFRKFFTTQLIQSKVNPEIREMLLGHKIGLASAYYRPTEQEMFTEYEKAIDSLTINEENRLRRKVETLTIDDSRLDRMERAVERLEKLL